MVRSASEIVQATLIVMEVGWPTGTVNGLVVPTGATVTAMQVVDDAPSVVIAASRAAAVASVRLRVNDAARAASCAARSTAVCATVWRPSSVASSANQRNAGSRMASSSEIEPAIVGALRRRSWATGWVMRSIVPCADWVTVRSSPGRATKPFR